MLVGYSFFFTSIYFILHFILFLLEIVFFSRSLHTRTKKFKHHDAPIETNLSNEITDVLFEMMQVCQKSQWRMFKFRRFQNNWNCTLITCYFYYCDFCKMRNNKCKVVWLSISGRFFVFSLSLSISLKLLHEIANKTTISIDSHDVQSRLFAI